MEVFRTLEKIGETLIELENYDEAVSAYQTYLDYATGEFLDTLQISRAYTEIGHTYFLAEQYSQAIPYYDSALIFNKFTEDPLLISQSHTYLGRCYHNLDDFTKAIEYYQIAQNNVNETQDPWVAAEIYNDVGQSYLELGNFTTAESYFDQALTIYEETKHQPAGAAETWKNLGDLFYRSQDYVKAEKHYKDALLAMGRLNDTIIETLFNYGLVNISLKQYEDAIESFSNVISLSERKKNDEFIPRGFKKLGDSYKELGEFKKATDYYAMAMPYGDSLENALTARKLLEMEEAFKKDLLEMKQQMEQSEEEKQEAEQRATIFANVIRFGIILAFFIDVGDGHSPVSPDQSQTENQ